MSDLTVELRPEDLTASELERRCLAEIADLKQHRDPERTALRLAALVQSAVHRLRHMEESHAGSPDRDDPAGAGGAGDPDPFWHAPVHTVGGGWKHGPRPRTSATSIRPH